MKTSLSSVPQCKKVLFLAKRWSIMFDGLVVMDPIQRNIFHSRAKVCKHNQRSTKSLKVGKIGFLWCVLLSEKRTCPREEQTILVGLETGCEFWTFSAKIWNTLDKNCCSSFF